MGNQIVYVLVKRIDYEGDTILGLYRDRANAIRLRDDLLKKAVDENCDDVYEGDNFTVLQFEIK